MIASSYEETVPGKGPTENRGRKGAKKPVGSGGERTCALMVFVGGGW
jgi:hypothetical protein